MIVLKGKLGSLFSGVVFLLLALLLFWLLFGEGMWEGTEFDWLGLLSGVVMLGLSLWLLRDLFSRTSDSGTPVSTPVVDEWIGERGLEDTERAQWRQHLASGEDLLVLIAAWGNNSIDRLAVTTHRIVLYPQQQIPVGVSIRYDQLVSVEQVPHRMRQHLMDLRFSVADGRVITFDNAGRAYAQEVVDLITQRQSASPLPRPVTRGAHFCTQCGASCQDTDQFCGVCGARRAR